MAKGYNQVNENNLLTFTWTITCNECPEMEIVKILNYIFWTLNLGTIACIIKSTF